MTRIGTYTSEVSDIHLRLCCLFEQAEDNQDSVLQNTLGTRLIEYVQSIQPVTQFEFRVSTAQPGHF